MTQTESSDLVEDYRPLSLRARGTEKIFLHRGAHERVLRTGVVQGLWAGADSEKGFNEVVKVNFKPLLCFCYVWLCYCYVLQCFCSVCHCFALFCYVFAMFCYVLLWFAMSLLCFAMFVLCLALFCYVCYVLLRFSYVLLCLAMFLLWSWPMDRSNIWKSFTHTSKLKKTPKVSQTLIFPYILDYGFWNPLDQGFWYPLDHGFWH